MEIVFLILNYSGLFQVLDKDRTGWIDVDDLRFRMLTMGEPLQTYFACFHKNKQWSPQRTLLDYWYRDFH